MPDPADDTSEAGRMEKTNPPRVCPARPADLVQELHALGLRPGDTVMVHASLKALGPIDGGPAAVAAAIMEAVGPTGTVMAYCAWDRSPYEETLNGARLAPDAREAWPAFDPRTAGTYRGFGLLNEYLCRLSGARRSGHPDASMVAVGAHADALVEPHALGAAFGPGSPLDRFRAMGGRVLLLGAPLDAVTVLHLAETLARIPHKRRVRYEMPILEQGTKVWRRTEEFDSNGILDCFAVEGEMDAVETIARLYVSEGRAVQGRIGRAACHLIEAPDIVDYGIRWLERLFGERPG